jgi:hypothetical protein
VTTMAICDQGALARDAVRWTSAAQT